MNAVVGAINKAPKTERGHRTRRALLDAAAQEFGQKGYHEASVSSITARAGVALGSFYTWFDSKEALFQALVSDLSDQVRDHVTPALAGAPNGLAAERNGLASFLQFVRSHQEIYRIIDEAEFVDPASFRRHYTATADRILSRLRATAERGEIRNDVGEVHAWAIMGMNVFLGLRYGVWTQEEDTSAIADTAAALLQNGIKL